MVFFKVQAEAERQRNVCNMSSFEDENELKSFEYAHWIPWSVKLQVEKPVYTSFLASSWTKT